MAKADLTAERLRELLDYNPETGVFTWRVDRGTNRCAGKVAGTLNACGMRAISIDGRSFYEHTLAWLYVYGELTALREIVRINGVGTDSRIANLCRLVKSENKEVTPDRVKSELDYCPLTGILRWKVAPVNSIKAGDVAGAIDKQGYIRIKLGRRTYSAHRLAWFVTHGKWPTGEIDHINGIQNDNRLQNLRDVSKAQNLQNQKIAQRGNQSGLLGAYYNHGKWRSAIQVSGKTITLGNFATAEQAHAAYLEAKRRLHSTCTI